MISWSKLRAKRSKAVNELVLSRRENRALAGLAAEPKPASEIHPDILETLASHGLIVEILGHWRTTPRGQLELHRQRFRKQPGRRVARVTPSSFLFLQETAFAENAPTRATLREFVRRRRELDAIPFISSIWPRPGSAAKGDSAEDLQAQAPLPDTSKTPPNAETLTVDESEPEQEAMPAKQDPAADAEVSTENDANAARKDVLSVDGATRQERATESDEVVKAADSIDEGAAADTDTQAVMSEDKPEADAPPTPNREDSVEEPTSKQSVADSEPQDSEPDSETAQQEAALEPDAIDEVLEQFGISLPETDEIKCLTEQEPIPDDDEPPILELSETDIIKTQPSEADRSSSAEDPAANTDTNAPDKQAQLPDEKTEDADGQSVDDTDCSEQEQETAEADLVEEPSSDDTVVQWSQLVGRRRSRETGAPPKSEKQDVSSEG